MSNNSQPFIPEDFTPPEIFPILVKYNSDDESIFVECLEDFEDFTDTRPFSIIETNVKTTKNNS